MPNYKGKYYDVDINNPGAKGICDRSGFAFNHKDLVKQMEWRGESLEWTGLMVGRPFLDKPNEQLRTPEIGPDSVPIEDPRLPTYTDVCWSNQMLPWSRLKVQNWASWGSVQHGVKAATIEERTKAAEEVRPAAVEYSSGPYQGTPEVKTPQEILESLENFDWSQTKWQT